MKSKILCLLLAVVMLIGCLAILSSCGETPEDPGNNNQEPGNTDPGNNPEPEDPGTSTCTHRDLNKDNICDKCGATLGGSEGSTDYPWNNTSIIFQMTENSNNEELSSGCKRYLAGEDASQTSSIDDDVRTRNTRAYTTTNVSVTYTYLPDTANYNWSKNIENIYTEVSAGASDAPDIYCNFVYDMVSTSLKGSFANLYSTSRGTGNTKGLNYFSFLDEDYNEKVDNKGYMYEYMRSLTLSKFKMYCISSDYFTDMVRAFFVVPVNVTMLEGLDVEGLTEDLDGDDKYTIDDFYDMVKQGEWTYDKMAQFCAAVYQPGAGSTGTVTLDDKLGFAISESSGLSASGMLYTTSVVIISRTWSEEKNDYVYAYPSSNEDLIDFCKELKDLFEGTGVLSVSDSMAGNYGNTSLIAIRNRFAANKILFGGVICVGSLEYPEYQNMKDAGGFGVVPVPLYRENSDDKYLTQIHNVGRIGGISNATSKFAQCTAFLDYQSTHSTDILNNYYNYKLQYDVADGSPGTVYMMQYIRSNVRSSFDKAYEDAIGKFFSTVNEASNENKWHTMLMRASFQMENMREKYTELYNVKEGYLQSLINEFDKLPN